MLFLMTVVVAFVYLFMCPYTKYDHLEFPGVVPRTFIGPILVSSLAHPFVTFSQMLKADKFVAQIIVRAVLGLVVLFCLREFARTVRYHFGQHVYRWFVAITCSQFHLLYYCTRPLPNTFAFAIALLAMRFWMAQDHRRFVRYSAFAILVFRSELSLLLGAMLIMDLVSRRTTPLQLLCTAVPAGVFSLAATIVIDTYFWQRPLWPEGEVLWYNTVQNKSSNWGTMPLLWYFYSAVPRAALASLVLVPVGACLDWRVRALLLPASIFVAAYSLLPHKELRFIIYVFPLLNVAAAKACATIYQIRERSARHQLLAVGVVAHIFLNAMISSDFVNVSRMNYPGGKALEMLHQLEPSDEHVHVHIDVYAAQTGVSRFAELNAAWTYNKTESLPPGGADMLRFTHLLVGGAGAEALVAEHYADTHAVAAVVRGFAALRLDGRRFPFVFVESEPRVFVLRRRRGRVLSVVAPGNAAYRS